MKRIIIMLLIVCSIVSTAMAQKVSAIGKQKNYPVSVQQQLKHMIDKFGTNEGQVYSVIKNPNTGLVEMSQRISKFSCSQDNPNLKSVATFFMQDEPYSYQIQHITPGSRERFSIKVVSDTGQPSSTLHIRTSTAQEMWLMCAKNPENPQLRDAYAIVWELSKDEQKAVGTIYMITSLRPDMYEKAAESKMFKIVGRVDENIKDSLYNIYIADSREALYNLEDHEYVACIPVVNKRFEWQTELTKPCVGRLRCIFPDGELCSAWIDLDFVPGETYNITVHNGYYDEDKDYERRVGRQSGHSLIEPNAVKVREPIRRENLPDNATYIGPVEVEEDTEEAEYTKASPSNNLWQPSPAQKMQIEAKGTAMEAKMKSVKAMYQALDPKNNASWMRKDLIFDQINKQNKEVDAAFHDLLKFIKSFEIPADQKAEFYGGGYKPMMDFYTEQNKGLTEMMSSGIQLPKSAQKTQKALNKYIEKYMTEMTKLMSEMK